MKKIIFLMMVLFSFKTVGAVTITQSFDDVFITYETDDGVVETNAVNVITGDGSYLYKLYFGEVSNYDYSLYEDEFLKAAYDYTLNSYVYHSEEINTEDDVKWYYVTQLLIYQKIYYEYDIYFSDSSGNKISFLEDEVLALKVSMSSGYYDIKEIEVYNNMELPFEIDDYYGVSSNLDVTTTDGAKCVEFSYGTEGTVVLKHYFDKGEDAEFYVNDDNFILFAGGGEFTETQTVYLTLQNTSTIESNNPVTGNISPFVPIIIGIPTIILGCLVYKKIKEN